MALHLVNLASISAANLESLARVINEGDVVVVSHGEHVPDKHSMLAENLKGLNLEEIFWLGALPLEPKFSARAISVDELVKLSSEQTLTQSWF